MVFSRKDRCFVRGDTLGRQVSVSFVFSCIGKMLTVFVHETKPPHKVGLLLEPVLFFILLDQCLGCVGNGVTHGRYWLKQTSRQFRRQPEQQIEKHLLL